MNRVQPAWPILPRIDPYRFLVWSIRFALVAVLIAGWAFETTQGRVSPLLLPPITSVAARTYALIHTQTVWANVAVTGFEIVAAFVFATLAGLLIGALASRTAFRAQVVEPLLNFGYMVPLIMFFPMMTLWFGVGPLAKIVYGAVAGFFPIAINTIRGFRSVNPVYVAMGRAYGASKVQSEIFIKWAAALPLVLAGIRLGAAICVISVIVGEMLSSESGLGQLLTESAQFFRPADTYAISVILIVLVNLLNRLINRLRV